MKKQIKNQKGFSPMVAVVILGIVVVIIALFLFGKTGSQPTTQNVPAIKSSSDLNTVTSDLDNIDTSQFDKELNQLDTDASAF